jgi:hypothetical protein
LLVSRKKQKKFITQENCREKGTDRGEAVGQAKSKRIQGKEENKDAKEKSMKLDILFSIL